MAKPLCYRDFLGYRLDKSFDRKAYLVYQTKWNYSGDCGEIMPKEYRLFGYTWFSEHDY